MKFEHPVNIHDFFKVYHEQLRLEADYFSNQLHHSGEKGRLNESHFASILRRHLPNKYGIGTGFVAAAHDGKARSHQCDIVIYDALQNAPLYSSEAFGVYPIEMVYAVIEVKTNINNPGDLEDCFVKCQHLRSMTQDEVTDENLLDLSDSKKQELGIYKNHQHKTMRAYKRYIGSRITTTGRLIRGPYYNALCPRFIVFSYGGWAKDDTLYKNFLSHTKTYPEAHIHELCVLNDRGGLSTGHLAFKQGEEKVRPIKAEGGFKNFLLGLPRLLEGMLPPSRLGNGFDLADLDPYDLLADQFKNADQEQDWKKE